jgi:hypothetical protein
MTKYINLEFKNEKDFFALANLKARYEMIKGDTLSWEEFVLKLKINFERGLK